MIRLLLILIFTLCFYTNLFAQRNSVYPVYLSKIPATGILLDRGWKFHAGDNIAWARTYFDDGQWQNINPTQDIYDLRPLLEQGIGWFRLYLHIDSTLLKESLVLMIEQAGASEIYLNGDRIYTFGKVSSNDKAVKTFDPLNKPVSVQFNKAEIQVLAVRYAYKKDIPYLSFAGRSTPCFAAVINSTNQQMDTLVHSMPLYIPDLWRSGIFLLLFILHFALYLFYPKRKGNFYFSLFAIAATATNILYIIAVTTNDIATKMYFLWITIILFNLYNLLFLKALYAVVQYKRNLIYNILSVCFLISVPLYFYPYHYGWILGFIILPNAISLECVRISFLTIRHKQQGAVILAAGASSFLLFYVSFYLAPYFVSQQYLTDTFYHLTYGIGVLSLPIATSVFMALEFAFTNRSLEIQLTEVQRLSAQTIAQEQERQQILATQNEVLEQQVAKRTTELVQQQTALQETLEDLRSMQVQLIQSEKEKIQAHHIKEVHELEAKALRAQMNPHFIFNCMNSIKALIQKGEQEKAILYLTTFSKLIRTIFQNSDKREITLFDELETCRLYNELESLRFNGKFSYAFKIDQTLDLKSIMVPAMIIQPFIENAIWHGIMPKEDGGAITVNIAKTEDTICCTIDDNGIGRAISQQNKCLSPASSHQSKGERLTQARLDLDNLLNNRKASITIIDKKDENEKASGTTVLLTFQED